MPEMDGFELTAAIRAHDDEQRRFPIVAITANALQGEAEHCLAAGMDDYLSKPLEMPKLKAALRKWMPWPMVEPAAAGIGQHDNGLAADAEPAAPPVDEVPGDGPIDPSALMGMFGDDPQTFREILQDFPAPARANIDEIETAVAERSAGGVAGGAHKLKSSARAVGAHELADVCLSLETAGKAEDWDTIEADAPQLSRIMSGDIW